MPCTVSSSFTTGLTHITESDSAYLKLLDEFPTLTSPIFTQTHPAHGVEHIIPTSGPPVHARGRRLPPDKLAAAKKEFEAMEDMGIVCHSNSPWSSALHLVPKSNGGWRHVGTTDVLMTPQHPTVTLYPIFRTVLLGWQEGQYSPK